MSNRALVPTRPSHSQQGVSGFTFTLIDYPGAIAQQFPFGINDAGKIAGYYNLTDGTAKSFLLQGTAFKDVVFPGAAVTLAFGINKSGTIVGTYSPSGTSIESHGFTFKGTTYKSFDFPGSTYTNPYNINVSGDIVGIYANANLVPHAFLLHKGTFTSFDAPYGQVLTAPYAISKKGTIVGIYQLPQDGTNHGFVLDNGTYTQVDFPGAVSTDLNGINDVGDIVGDYTLDGSTYHAFLLQSGTFTSFDVPFPGAPLVGATGINNNGQIIGTYGANDNTTFYSFGFLTSH
jgi:uncharacterized membrane protein